MALSQLTARQSGKIVDCCCIHNLAAKTSGGGMRGGDLNVDVTVTWPDEPAGVSRARAQEFMVNLLCIIAGSTHPRTAISERSFAVNGPTTWNRRPTSLGSSIWHRWHLHANKRHIPVRTRILLAVANFSNTTCRWWGCFIELLPDTNNPTQLCMVCSVVGPFISGKIRRSGFSWGGREMKGMREAPQSTFITARCYAQHGSTTTSRAWNKKYPLR